MFSRFRKYIMQRHRIPLVSILCLVALYASARAIVTFHVANIQQVPQQVQQGPQKQNPSGKPNAKVVRVLKAKKALQRENSEHQILKDSVIFFHDGAYLYCDSAYWYEKENSFEAFSNVRMEQGDTLFLNGRYMHYDGNTKIVHVRENVNLYHSPLNRRNIVTLFTDSLNYDRMMNIGYYFDGGVLVDSLSELSSFWGQYEPSLKLATFKDSVILTNPNFTLYSDQLKYDTDKRVALISTPTRIVSDSGLIYTSRGWYNTVTEESLLLDRSRVLNLAGDRSLTGDSILYNKAQGYGEVFGGMILEDTTKRVMLLGNYGFYNELEDWALATDSAYAIEYSQGDSLFIHADTLRLLTVVDTLQNSKLKLPEKLIASIPDSLAISDSILANPLLGDSLKIGLEHVLSLRNDSLPTDSLNMYSLVKDRIASNQIQMATDSVVPQVADSTKKVFRLIKAYYGVRFFRSDIQGVCDSLQFSAKDSILHMYKEPVLWNTNRQLYGDTIHIFMNDSTIDRMIVRENSFSIEQKDSLHYNQLKSRSLKIFFKESKLSRVFAEGGVETIAYPEDKNGVLSLVHNLLKSGYLEIFMENGAFKELIAWPKPATTGQATPFHLLKTEQLRLPGFLWFDYMRPLDRHDIFRKVPKKAGDKRPTKSKLFDRVVDDEFGY